MGTHEDSVEMNFRSFLPPKSLQFKVDQVVSHVKEIKQTQIVLSESINRSSEEQATMAESILKIQDKEATTAEPILKIPDKQATMAKSILKIQDSLLDSKVDDKVGEKVLALLETSLRSFQTALQEIMVDLTAVKGAAVAQEAKLLKVVADVAFS